MNFVPSNQPQPLGRWIKGCDTGARCDTCTSGLHVKFLFFTTKKCIHPDCSNYHKINNKKVEKYVNHEKKKSKNIKAS